ncbi:hypothetical protein SJAG_04962 [Schizosaccharomyces japonicus yFS275]|uniref:Uncharacterized protein n=1 Tax=Schizosaccharomyces japonicus (strain yFS275 / FY16936) TaxID=402676 RepID=B6K882_SCHJY|nr:hypothetical protein SJAG_04962 [Schizosaccharomyces japonicus yFS275]EEB09736.2 hypothetical protein SJAG_04962 [Schizosaccharomyces japonicus yFS275]
MMMAQATLTKSEWECEFSKVIAFRDRVLVKDASDHIQNQVPKQRVYTILDSQLEELRKKTRDSIRKKKLATKLKSKLELIKKQKVRVARAHGEIEDVEDAALGNTGDTFNGVTASNPSVGKDRNVTAATNLTALQSPSSRKSRETELKFRSPNKPSLSPVSIPTSKSPISETTMISPPSSAKSAFPVSAPSPPLPSNDLPPLPHMRRTSEQLKYSVSDAPYITEKVHQQPLSPPVSAKPDSPAPIKHEPSSPYVAQTMAETYHHWERMAQLSSSKPQTQPMGTDASSYASTSLYEPSQIDVQQATEYGSHPVAYSPSRSDYGVVAEVRERPVTSPKCLPFRPFNEVHQAEWSYPNYTPQRTTSPFSPYYHRRVHLNHQRAMSRYAPYVRPPPSYETSYYAVPSAPVPMYTAKVWEPQTACSHMPPLQPPPSQLSPPYSAPSYRRPSSYAGDPYSYGDAYGY